MTELTLRQRIAVITGEIKITATGTTGERMGNRRAISIGDVDAALGPLMAKHGVVSHYRFIEEPTVAYEMPTRSEGVLRMWKVHIEGIIEATEDRMAVPGIVLQPGQEFRQIEGAAERWAQSATIRADLWDIGSSPSGAVSFALKRWHRALFHLAEDDDQVDKEDQARARAAAARPAVAAAPKEQKKPLTLAQQIAMICNKLGIERSHLIKAVTGKEHGKDLTREEALEVLTHARALESGTRRLVEVDGEWSTVLADLAQPSQVSLPVDGETR